MATNDVDKELIKSTLLGFRPRVLQIFSRYREYGGEEGSCLLYTSDAADE